MFTFSKESGLAGGKKRLSLFPLVSLQTSYELQMKKIKPSQSTRLICFRVVCWECILKRCDAVYMTKTASLDIYYFILHIQAKAFSGESCTLFSFLIQTFLHS